MASQAARALASAAGGALRVRYPSMLGVRQLMTAPTLLPYVAPMLQSFSPLRTPTMSAVQYASVSPASRSPLDFGWLPFAEELDAEKPAIVIEVMNRNSRRPNKANHGARPCSSFARRARRPRGTNSGRRRGN
jgi:hypothetical protein